MLAKLELALEVSARLSGVLVQAKQAQEQADFVAPVVQAVSSSTAAAAVCLAVFAAAAIS